MVTKRTRKKGGLKKSSKIPFAGLAVIVILLSLITSGTVAVKPSRLEMPGLILLAVFLLTGLLLVVPTVIRTAIRHVAEIKKLIVLFGVAGATGLSFFNFVLFLLAYNSPTKSFVVPVNNYGEAGVELIILLITVILIACSSLWIFKQYLHGKRM